MKSRPSSHHIRLQAVAAAILALVPPAAGQDCPQLLGRWPYGEGRGVAVAGSLAFVGSGSAVLVLDISDPSSPRRLGDVVLPALVEGIAAAGDHVVVADGPAGLRVVDVSDPTAPVEVGAVETPDRALDVAVAGGRAFVACDDEGLRVVDISVPSLPAELGAVDFPGAAAQGVAVAGSHAYVAASSSGLRVVSVADPSAPVEVGLLDTPGYARDVTVAGGYAYIADGNSGLRVASVASPAAPVEVGAVDVGGDARAVAVAGGVAFVGAEFRPLYLVDVSDPSAPVTRGALPTYNSRWNIAADAGLVYAVGDFDGLVIGELSDPTAPTVVGALPAAGDATSVAIAGGLAFVGVFPPGVRVIDVSAPSAPVEAGWLEMEDTPLGIAVPGSHGYVAELSAGFSVLDLSTPDRPVVVARVDTPGEARGVTVVGNLAYLADGSSGLRIFDVEKPEEPAELASVDTPGTAYGVVVSGDIALIADQSAGLTVVDVGSPTAPTVIATLATPDSANGVAVAGGLAYVAASRSGLRVIDISVPTAPVEIASLALAGRALDVAVVSDLVYAALENGGLAVIDVRDPSVPVEVGVGDTPGDADAVAVGDGIVVVADSGAGVAVFDDCRGTTPLANDLFIPAAAVAGGAQGAFFQTDVEVNNAGTDPAQVTFQWLPRGEDNSDPLVSEPIVLAPGQSERIDNVLAELFGLAPDSAGALRLVATTAEVIGMSRTYNTPEGKIAGTFGQGLPAVRSADMIAGTGPRRLMFLSENAASRANVGCVNGTADDVVISLALHTSEGARLATRTMDLGPYSSDQVNRIFRDFQPVSGYVDVSADDEDARYFCYGSMLDNETSDPTTILPQTPSAGLIFVPAAALAAGLEGAFFETDLELNNAGPAAVGYRLWWLPRGADNSTPTMSERFSLAAGRGVRYTNVLESVFQLEEDQVGALAVDADAAGLLAMSRTYNVPSAGTAGTFGQELPGIPADRMLSSGERKRIIFMNENADVRSNVGCVNGSAATAVVTVKLHSAGGEALETKTMTLPPYSSDQITRVFRGHAPVEAGYVDVWTTTPGASIYCYGSVLDNTTSDPTTVLPQ